MRSHRNTRRDTGVTTTGAGGSLVRDDLDEAALPALGRRQDEQGVDIVQGHLLHALDPPQLRARVRRHVRQHLTCRVYAITRAHRIVSPLHRQAHHRRYTSSLLHLRMNSTTPTSWNRAMARLAVSLILQPPRLFASERNLSGTRSMRSCRGGRGRITMNMCV